MVILRYIFVFSIITLGLFHFEVCASNKKSQNLKQTMFTLLAIKNKLAKQIEQHRKNLRHHASSHRHNWKKKIKTNPKAKYEYKACLFLHKKLCKLNEAISSLQKILTSSQPMEETIIKAVKKSDLPYTLQNEINRFYQKAIQSMTNKLHQQKYCKVSHLFCSA